MWEEWCTRWGRDGRGKDRPTRGSVRRRDVSRSPPDSRCPPGKKVDTRDRPRLDNRKDSISLIDFGLEEPRQGRVVDIAQEVF